MNLGRFSESSSKPDSEHRSFSDPYKLQRYMTTDLKIIYEFNAPPSPNHSNIHYPFSNYPFYTKNEKYMFIWTYSSHCPWQPLPFPIQTHIKKHTSTLTRTQRVTQTCTKTRTQTNSHKHSHLLFFIHFSSGD